MTGYRRQVVFEAEARIENTRVQEQITHGPLWPYERRNWQRWKALGEPRDMMIILGDGSVFWSRGRHGPDAPTTPWDDPWVETRGWMA